jgi:flavin reductase
MTITVERAELPSADRDSFIVAMRRAASTVTVVTTAGRAGHCGLTVSAMSSVSADPPSVLVCVNRASPAAAAIAANGVFCVNLLTEHQRAISELFAGRLVQDRSSHRESGAWTRLVTGAPVLAGAAAVFDYRLGEQHRFGSHVVLVGVVVAATCGAGRPLVYHDRGYGAVATEPGAREIDETNAALGALGWGF